MAEDEESSSLKLKHLFVFLSIIGIVLIAGCVSNSNGEQAGECTGEGESIPVIASPPSCCAGLTLILSKQAGIMGSAGICTANCGNGVCDEDSESSYNCPVDCSGSAEDFCGFSTSGPCTLDSDCTTDGCSGEVCRSKSELGVDTTCMWRDCYDDTKYGLACGCVEGQCEWH